MEQPDTVQISLGQLTRESVNLANLANQIISAREAGFRIQLKVDQPETMALLQYLPEAVAQQANRRLAIPRVLGWALAASLGSMLLLAGVMLP